MVLTIDRNYRRLIIGTVQLILLGLNGRWLVGCGIRLLTPQCLGNAGAGIIEMMLRVSLININ